MSTRLADLAARRRALVARSDVLRAGLAVPAQGLERILGFADLGVSAVRYPLLLLLGIGAALSIVRPRRLVRTVSFALTALSIARQLRQVLGPRRSSQVPRSR